LQTEKNQGNELFYLLVKQSGLPENEVVPLLKRLIEKLNLDPFKLEMEDVRKVMLFFLQECFGDSEKSLDEEFEAEDDIEFNFVKAQA